LTDKIKIKQTVKFILKLFTQTISCRLSNTVWKQDNKQFPWIPVSAGMVTFKIPTILERKINLCYGDLDVKFFN